MKKIITNIKTQLLIGSLMLLPGTALAQPWAPNSDAAAASAPGTSATLVNPLKANSIQELFNNLIEVVLVFALPIAVGFIMYGGFKLVMAQGNPGEITKARQIIQWAVIGAIIIFGAKQLLSVFVTTVKSI